MYNPFVWAFKGAACASLPGKYLDIAQAISQECGWPVSLMPNQFKDVL